jgi:hypothetical protein
VHVLGCTVGNRSRLGSIRPLHRHVQFSRSDLVRGTVIPQVLYNIYVLS